MVFNVYTEVYIEEVFRTFYEVFDMNSFIFFNFVKKKRNDNRKPFIENEELPNLRVVNGGSNYAILDFIKDLNREKLNVENIF